jgi:hypothetical protein
MALQHLLAQRSKQLAQRRSLVVAQRVEWRHLHTTARQRNMARQCNEAPTTEQDMGPKYNSISHHHQKQGPQGAVHM